MDRGVKSPVVADWWSQERQASAFTEEFIDAIESGEPAVVGRIGLSDGRMKAISVSDGVMSRSLCAMAMGRLSMDASKDS